ncbi:beta-N-acetylhexosaminidase [Actinomycetes bacterium KLBMP 9797]
MPENYRPDPTALVPAVTSAAWTGDRLTLAADTTVSAPPNIARLVREYLCGPTGLPLNGSGSGGPVLAFDTVPDPSLGEEGYRLHIDEAGVRAVAAGDAGLRWAVQTLRQVLPVEIYMTEPVRGVPWTLPTGEVYDAPALPWRGALLDVARWHQPVEFLFEFVELLALHKLNTLHLHLTDDQGWRFESIRYPRLTDVGGWRTGSPYGDGIDERPHGGFYTQTQLRDLVAHAAQRGVRIMPEVDLPGHMQAAVAAYPHLGNEPSRRLPVRTRWGISPHVLNTEPATVAFMRDVIDEIVDVFPFQYVHLGGDEVPLSEWSSSAAARRTIAEHGLSGAGDLLGWWIAQIGRHLTGQGRTPAAWDEVVDAGAPRDTLVFAWQSADRVDAALAKGYRVVAVPQEFVYLDLSETGAPNEPPARSGFLPLSRVYGFDPAAGQAAGRVLGTQGMLWAEHMSEPALVRWRAFPRLTAIADRTWSSAPDEARFLASLPAHLRRLDRLGVGYNSLPR